MSEYLSPASLNRLITRMSAIIFELDPHGMILKANHAFTQATGYSLEELQGQAWWDLLFPGDQREGARRLFRLILRGDVSNYEIALTRKNGAQAIFEINTANEYRDDGALEKITGFGVDITLHKTTEEALRKSEERYRQVLESVKDYAIFTLDTQGIVTSWNPGAERIKGFTAQEILGKHFSIFYTPEAKASHKPEKVLAQAAAEGRYEEEGWRVRKGGQRFWASVTISPIYDREGRLFGFTKVVRDRSRRKQAEEALERQTLFVSLLQEVAVAANQATSVEEVVQFSLDQICIHTGWKVGHAWLREHDHGDLVSLKVWHLEDPKQYETFRKGSEALRIASGEDLPGLVLALKEPLWFNNMNDLPNYVRRDLHGEGLIQVGVASPIWAGKEVAGVIEFFCDESSAPDKPLLEVMAHIGTQVGRVIERKRLESEVAELQRRLMDGREAERVDLARKLHDGPVQDLYGISFNLKAFSDGLPGSIDQGPIHELLGNIQRVARILRQITGELRPPTLSHFGLEKAIRSHVEIFKETHPELDVLLDLAPDGQSLSEMTRLALFGIYLHAMNNVVQHAQARQMLVRLVMEPEQVILEIHDNGAGFTLPSRWIDIVRKGHLGLAGAYERAQAIGGQLSVQSAPGKGTQVRVVAPRTSRVKLEV